MPSEGPLRARGPRAALPARYRVPQRLAFTTRKVAGRAISAEGEGEECNPNYYLKPTPKKSNDQPPFFPARGASQP